MDALTFINLYRRTRMKYIDKVGSKLKVFQKRRNDIENCFRDEYLHLDFNFPSQLNWRKFNGH